MYEDLLDGYANTVWNILLWTGYLTPLDNESDDEMRLKVPNKPVMDVFSEVIRKSNIIKSKKSYDLFDLIERNKIDEFKNKLDNILYEDYILSEDSVHDIRYEREDYHNILFSILCNLHPKKYALASNT